MHALQSDQQTLVVVLPRLLRPVGFSHGAQQVPDTRKRHSLLQDAGERAPGRGVFFRHPKGPLQNPEACHDLP